MDNAFTARNVAKWVANSIITVKVADIAADTITGYTRFEEDSLTVKLGSGAIGWFVASRLEPVTDKVVDKAADFISEQRTKRQAKKNRPQV